VKKEEQIVIVGNSGAAISAVKGIRQVNDHCSITLFSSEPHPAYSPVLTTYLLAGKINRNQMALVGEDFYRDHRVERRYKQRVISLKTTDRKVFLEDGAVIHYDKVLIATGAIPNQLDCDLPAGGPVFTLRTLEDAEKIQSRISHWRNVIFAGAGLVSIQIANALRKYLERMIFIVGSDQILSQNLDNRASSFIQRNVEAGGGTFLLNRKILRVEEFSEGVVVHTDRGEAIKGNALVVGKGVRPNIPEFVPEGIIEVGRGIRVDKRMHTSAEAIYAAGDVCEAKDLISEKYRLVSNWPNACFQGLVAGQNMGGGEAFFEGSLAMNVTSVFGLSFASIGEVREDPDGETETFFYVDDSRRIYKKWVFRDDRLIGAILLGDVGENAFVAEIIRRQQQISLEKKALMSCPSNSASILCGLL
jgi:NAD(P)H-nitrite reductase large subunit